MNLKPIVLKKNTVNMAVMLMLDGPNTAMERHLGPLDASRVMDMLTGEGGIIEHNGVRYAVPGLPQGDDGNLDVYKVPDRGNAGSYVAVIVKGAISGDAHAIHTYVDKYIALWLRIACMLCGVYTKAVRVRYADNTMTPKGVMMLRSLDLDPMVLDATWDDNVNALLGDMRRLAETGMLRDHPMYMIRNGEGIIHPYCMPEYVLAWVDKYAPAEIYRSVNEGWTWEPVSREAFEKLPVHHKGFGE